MKRGQIANRVSNIKSLAYISIYLGFFGWLFGSDKKEKQDQTSSVQESFNDRRIFGRTSPVDEAQVRAPELANGLPLKNAKYLLKWDILLHKCGTCHTSFILNGKMMVMEKMNPITHFEYIYPKGLPFKDSPLCQNAIFRRAAQQPIFWI